MRHVGDDERRARLAVRHALAPAAQVATPEAATAAMTVLHSTEPATVHLSCWARVPGVQVEDVERALYRDRSLVKQLAMRRTLFVFPRALLPAAWPSASARVAATERARMAKQVVAAGIADDGDAWLDRARADVIAALADEPAGLTAAEIRERVPPFDVPVAPSAGSAWSIPRVLTHLGATADVMRAENTGHWRTSRPRWTLAEHWLGEDAAPRGEAAVDSETIAAGYLELVRRWLWTFGPGTETDLVWWLGSTKAVVRRALADVEAVEVSLDGGGRGWLLPDDLDEVEPPGPWTALLPVLDPTIMGWKERDFHLGPHRARLFDTRGNAGTTAWVDGRAVGCWTQDEAGVVALHLLEPVPAAARRSLEADAARLTDWLGGVRVGTVYKSPAMTEVSRG